MSDKPAEAVRAKPDSSLVRAVRAVGDGDAAAVISAGNTGAVLAASLLHLRRLPGVHRPGIAIVIPGRQGPTVLIDAGANAEARPEHLVQFGHMGTVFAQEMLDVVRPLGSAALDRRGAREGEPADARGARAPRGIRPAFRRERRGSDAARRGGGRHRLRRLHRQRRPQDARRDDPGRARRAARRDPRVGQGPGGRPVDPACSEGPALPPRPGDLRRRLPSRVARPRGDRARLQLPCRDRKRNANGRPGRRAPPRRAARGAHARDARREPPLPPRSVEVLFLGLPLRDPSRPEAGFAGREASLGQSVHSAEEGGSWWKHGFPHASTLLSPALYPSQIRSVRFESGTFPR